MQFAPGKLPPAFLDRLLKKYAWNRQLMPDARVIIGPQIGQDVAVVDFGDRYLVSKTDPVTFATDEIGYYAVNINANDIATSGAKPQWFQATVLLPEKGTDEARVERIFADIAQSCQNLGIAWIGGHTEITFGLERPIVIGSMFGEVPKDRLITSMGGKAGDAILITKGIPIEGTAIIALEKAAFLRTRGISQDIIDQSKDLLHSPGLSVVREAALLHSNFEIHAMHDPTEGGLAMGLVELAENSGCGLDLDYNKIPILPQSTILCGVYGLDLLSTITSGTLVVALKSADAERAVQLLRNNNIHAAVIGTLTANPGQYFIRSKTGIIETLRYTEKDEITRIFEE
jgi:hydrogenase maturation factor